MDAKEVVDRMGVAGRKFAERMMAEGRVPFSILTGYDSGVVMVMIAPWAVEGSVRSAVGETLRRLIGQRDDDGTLIVATGLISECWTVGLKKDLPDRLKDLAMELARQHRLREHPLAEEVVHVCIRSVVGTVVHKGTIRREADETATITEWSEPKFDTMSGSFGEPPEPRPFSSS